MHSGPRPPIYRRLRRRGFTLVELLVALALTGLVAAIGGRVAVQWGQTRQAARQWAERLDRPALLESVLQEDFARLLESNAESAPLVVVEGSTLMLELPVLALIEPDDAALHVSLHPCVVRYWWIKQPNEPLGSIRRETIDQTQPARIHPRQTLALDLEELSVQVRRRGQWSTWIHDKAPRLEDVEAVRVQVRWIDDVEWSRTFVKHHAR